MSKLRQGGYLFRRLVGLTAVAALPLLALLAFNLWTSAQNARERALDVVDNQAIAVAREAEALLQSTQQYLVYLAAQPTIRALDARHCDPVLRGVTQRRAHFAQVLVLDAGGDLVCSADARDSRLSARFAGQPWFAAALDAAAPRIGRPFTLHVDGEPLLPVTLAVRNGRGEAVALLAVLIDLDSLQRAWQGYRLPPRARLSLVADDGTLLVTNDGFASWVGKDVSATVTKALELNPGGKGLATGIDGVERAFARRPVGDWPIGAYAAFPSSYVFADARAEFGRSLVVVALGLLAASALAVLLAQRLSAPLRALTRTAHAVRDGDITQRAPEAAPGEIGEVTQAFNAMLEGLQRSQAAVQATQRRYAELFAHIGLLSFIADREGVITQVNRTMLEATGWQRQDLQGRPLHVLLPVEGLAAHWLARAGEAAEAGGTTEQAICTRTGASLTVRWHHSLLRDAEDRPVGIASIGEDVTLARMAALRERRQLDFYTALSRTNSAIVRVQDEKELWWEICRICVDHGHASIAYIALVIDQPGGRQVARPIAWAGPAQAFLGGRDFPLDPDDRQGAGVTATAIHGGRRVVIDDADTDPATAPWRVAGRTIGTRSLAAFPFRRGGRVAGVLTLHMTSPGFFDAPVIALLEEMTGDLSFALDHLDRVADLRRTQQQLQEREQQLAGLVETAMDAIITVDAGQRVRLFNRAAVEMFGLPAAEAIGGPLDRLVPPRLRAVHGEHVRRFAVHGSTARRMGALQTLVGLRAGGQEFPIEASISKWGSGEQALMTVVIRDATELRRAEESRVARAAAESASEAKSRFLSHISHELRTPLNAIIGFSQLLQADVGQPLGRAQAEQVEYIRQAGWHLLALVSDVLDVSRIEAGHLRVELGAIDGAAVLADAVSLNMGLAAQQRVVLELAPSPPGAGQLIADPTRLRQALINVVSNAIKYNRPGGQVRAGLARAGRHVCFQVTDTGLGMTDDQLAHLYEPFNRLGRERGSVEGTGLGMALTRQLVALMDGHMQVRSQLGVGTEIEICLPADDGPAQDEAAAQARAAAAAAKPRGTVLYIEDNAVNRLLVEELLCRWPEVVLLIADDGRSGIALARQARPDVVLLDMRLPDMQGLEVLQALRADLALAGTKVVALSGDAQQQDRDAALQAGAHDYWTKPFDFERFMAGLAALLAPGA